MIRGDDMLAAAEEAAERRARRKPKFFCKRCLASGREGADAEMRREDNLLECPRCTFVLNLEAPVDYLRPALADKVQFRPDCGVEEMLKFFRVSSAVSSPPQSPASVPDDQRFLDEALRQLVGAFTPADSP